MSRQIEIDDELRDRLVDGRLLPLVDAASNGGDDRVRFRRQALARLLLSAEPPAVIAYRHPDMLHSVLAAADPSWRLASGFHSRPPSDAKLVLSAGESGGTVSPDDAWLRVEERQPVLWELMSSFAARFPLLLVGVDSESGALQDLVARLRPHRYFTPSGWIVAETVRPDVAARWQELGLRLVEMTDEAFVRACMEELNLRSPSVSEFMPEATDRTTRRPFKLLDYYDVEDAPIFYARRDETSSLIKLVTSNRLVVVAGPSGAGKTSLLKAGLMAGINRLHPYRGLYVRLMEDPVGELLNAMERELEVRCQRPTDAVQRREMWRLVDGAGALPVVIFDQGEELFTRFESTMRDDLFALIIEAVVHPRSRSRFVIGVREDYLAHFADLADRLPGVLQTSFYVGALTKGQALEAIRRPFEAFGIRLESGLENRIANDIGSERVASPQIQIVCDRLFSSRMSDAIDLDDYERLGGTEGILGDFLNDQLAILGSDRAGVVEILKSLVTSEGTKDVLSLVEISERTALPPDRTTRLVGHLTTRARLLRPISGRSGMRYELAHEYLTHEIWQWMSATEISRREAQELIAADLRAWITFDSLRLSVDRLEKYYEHASNIKVDEHVGTLLLLSCVRHSRPHALWVDAIGKLPGDAQTRIAWSLLRFISSRSDDQRFEAAEAMGSLGGGVVLAALSAKEPTIRHAALYMVGGLGLASARPVLIDLLENTEDERSEELACFALGEIGGAVAVVALVARISSASARVAAAAVRGLGGCRDEASFPHLAAALWSDRPDLVRAAQLGVAAAASPELSTYLAGTVEADSDVDGRAIAVSPTDRLTRILEGFDHVRGGDDQLLAPLAHFLRAAKVDENRFSTPWLVDGLTRINDGDTSPNVFGDDRFKGKLKSADDVIAALRDHSTDLVALALADGGPKSLLILRGLSSHASDEVRLTVLLTLWYYDALSSSDWSSYIRPSVLVRGLQDANAEIRYLACLAVENLKLVECVPFVRPLARDEARIDGWVANVGRRVCDAAHFTLDSLRPESKVWRKDWQLDASRL